MLWVLPTSHRWHGNLAVDNGHNVGQGDHFHGSQNGEKVLLQDVVIVRLEALVEEFDAESAGRAAE